jgi:calcineurin-like phosphoesterase family protein
MLYFTSDLHLGHANIIRLCNRPFASLEEMDETLIANWNARVTNGDTIYVLGDLMFRVASDPGEYLTRLKGKKHLILGNHDTSWIKKVDLAKNFQSVERLSVISTGKCKVTLCHYPMMSFEGSYLIYGHIHNNKNDTYWPLLRTMEYALNAGVEINGYQPVTFDELVHNNRAFRE